jgi:hypothetical protein
MNIWLQRLLLVGLGGLLGFFGYGFFDPARGGTPHGSASSASAGVPAPVKNVSSPAAVPDRTDEKTTWREANRERAAGNYVLDSHVPWVRERLAERDRKVIDAIMTERGPEYERMFADFGMTPQQIAQALHHISLIYQSKLDARKAMTVQMNAQMDFDIRMQQIMGDRYHEYLAFESLGRAREESLLIRQFAQSASLTPISDERADALNALIQESRAYSQRILGSLSGPRDQVARPNYGEAAVAELEENQAVLSLGSASVIERARQQGFTASEIATLESYFAKETASYEKQITQASNSVEGQIAVLERQLARMKRQNAGAWATAPYEDALGTLRSKQSAGR